MNKETHQKKIKKYYDDLYHDNKEKIIRPIQTYRIYLNHLGTKGGGRLLDIGCGAGYLLKNANDAGLQTFGLDISVEAIKIAQKTSPNSTLLLGPGEDLPFLDDYFDFITCLGSLEHFINTDLALNEMVRVSKKGARLCIMVPNINYKFGAGTEQIEEKLFPLEEWKKILQKNGLNILKIKQDKYFGKVISPKKILSQKGFKSKLRLLKRKLLWTFMPLDETYQFIFICNTIG